MGADIMRGFGLVPKRGAEVGGVLIGTIQSGIIRIEDFEPVPCSYARGPSYLLTDPERTKFEEVCQRRAAEAIGYYRSNTREVLGLQAEDLQLVDGRFQLALLVKPFATKPSVAGFFLRKNGVFPNTTPLEFPFRRWEMTGEEPPRRAPMQERKRAESQPQERVPAEPRREEIAVTSQGPPKYERIFSMEPKEPPEQQEPRGPKSRTGLWLVASFVFLLLGVLLGYEASRISSPPRGSDFALSLAVERTGTNLTVHWNPNALAVRSAGSGELQIDDGADVNRRELDRDNLNSGRFVYQNASDNVRFRLMVRLDSGQTVAEERNWSR
jgi:hypothetical protein